MYFKENSRLRDDVQKIGVAIAKKVILLAMRVLLTVERIKTFDNLLIAVH